MPVPASINDLSTTAGNNSPAGSESPTTTAAYLRTLSAFIATLRDGKQPIDPVLTALADQTTLGASEAEAARATIGAMANADADFVFVYPNGGSAGSPANVTANSQYVVTNPFPGYRVFCEPEIQVGGAWGAPGWYWASASAGYGVSAHQHNDGSIVVQTGLNGVTNTGFATGGSFGAVAATVTAPCRLKVRKLKGAL